MNRVFLLLVCGLIACVTFAREPVAFFSQNHGYALEVLNKEIDRAAVRVYQLAQPENALWNSSFQLPQNAQYTVSGSVSEDGRFAVIKADISSGVPGLVYFKDGEVVRQYAGSEIAAKLTDKTDQYQDDFLSSLQLAGGIRTFDRSVDPKFFCVWVGEKDTWFAIDLATGALFKPSPRQTTEWNARERERSLTFLKEIAPGGPATLVERLEAFHRDLPNNPLRLSFVNERLDQVRDMLKFLTRKQVPGDDQWIRALLDAPLGGGGYSFRPRGTISTGVTTLDLRADSHWRRLGDMLLAHWEHRAEAQEITGEWNYPGGGPFQYLGDLQGKVILPRPPTTNDGFLQVELRRESAANGINQNNKFQWQFGTAIEIATQISGQENARTEPISPEINLSLSTISPGNYRLIALWARTRDQPDAGAVALPGNYFSAGQAVRVRAGDRLEFVLSCTNQVPGNEDLDASYLKGFTNTYPADPLAPQKSDASLTGNQLRRLNGPLAEQVLTNTTLGPLKARKITYGKSHQFLSHHHTTKENLLVLWLDVPPDLKATGYRYQVIGRGGETFGETSFAGSIYENGKETIFVVLDKWPRRDPSFRLRAIDDKSQQMGEIILPNIVAREFTELKPEKFPSTNHIGSLQVIFEGISSDHGLFQPIIALRQGGMPAGAWSLGKTWFEDATGNRAFTLEGLMHERVLRCSVELFRNRIATFASDETWRMPLRLPAPGQFQMLTNTHLLQGVEIQLVAVAGIGEMRYQGQKIISGIPEVDSQANAYDNSVCRLFGSLSKPQVFVRGTGRDWSSFNIPNGKPDDFSVLGIKPHLALIVRGASEEHRIFVNDETLSEDVLTSEFARNSATRRGQTLFLPLNANSAETELKIIVQKRHVQDFTFEVPTTIRLKSRLNKVKILFFNENN